MENKSLLALATAAACLLMCKNTSSSCGTSYNTRVENNNNSVTVEVLGPGGTTTLMPATTVSINDDSTVLSASIDSFKENQIAFQTGGSGAGMYITSIAGLAQQSSGPLSGWLYKVNDAFIDSSPATYKVNSGDRITWVYTTDLGKDVGAPEVIFERRHHRTSFNNFNFNPLNR